MSGTRLEHGLWSRLPGVLLVAVVAACAAPEPRTDPELRPDDVWHEVPAPTTGWRGHRLSRCPPEPEVPTEVERRVLLELIHQAKNIVYRRSGRMRGVANTPCDVNKLPDDGSSLVVHCGLLAINCTEYILATLPKQALIGKWP